MRITRSLTALAIIAAGLLAGCAWTRASLPRCSIGRGNGHSATLAVRQHGDRFTGTYLTAIPGGAYLRYDVQGTARDGRLTSWWRVGAIQFPVTGTYTAGT